MVDSKSEGAMDVSNIREALPSARRHFRRTPAKPTSKPMPSSLPDCFAEVWRRRLSNAPADRRQRATLEAVASTITQDSTSLTGQSAAAVYLAALAMAVERLVNTTHPVRGPDQLQAEKPLSRKERKKQRKQERAAEIAVKDMPVSDVLGSTEGNQSRSASMDVEFGENSDGDSDDNVELISNLVYLIGLAVRGTSQAVLISKCERILVIIMRAYDHVFGHSSVARHTSVVFSEIIVVLDSPSWGKPSVQRAFLYLLRSTSDRNPKTRRKARDSLFALLRSPRAVIARKNSSAAASTHYVSELKLQTQVLEEALNGETMAEEKANPVALVHLLTSVERYAVFLNSQDAAKVAKELLIIAVKGVQSISSFAFIALNSLLKHRSDSRDANGSEGREEILLPQADLEKLLKVALKHDISPDSPYETIVAYNSCIASGSVAYADSFTYSSPPKDFIVQPVQKLCGSIDPRGGKSEVVTKTVVQLRGLLVQRWFKCRPEVLSELSAFTGTAYRLLWPDLTPLVRRYLEDSMTAGNAQMKAHVTSLATAAVAIRQKSGEIMDRKPQHGNAGGCQKAGESVDRKAQDLAIAILAAIVRGGGAERVLDACELRYDKKLHLTNAWVLPILRNGLCGAPFSLFTSRLVPMSEQLKGAMEKTAEEKRSVETKNLGIYYSQIWSLLPGFCNKPSDLAQKGILTMAFKAIHACFEADDKSAMYPVAVAALRQLSLSVSCLDGEDQTAKSIIDSFGNRFKKLYPIVTMVSECTPDDRRGLLLDAVTKAAVATKNPTLVSNLLRKSIRRLLELQVQRSEQKNGADVMEEEGDAVRKQHATADIAIAIAESNIIPDDAAETTFLEKAMSPFFLDGKQSSLQKKAYRATTLLVGHGAIMKSHDELRSFVKSIAEARKNVAPGAKASRQGLIAALVNRHVRMTNVDEKIQLLELVSDHFLSEVVLGTRDTSEKTRTASFDTLITMARGWNVTSSGTDMSGLQRFLIAVAAGLGGKTVPMLSSTLTSLGRLMYEFRGEASTNEKFATVMDSFFGSKVVGDRKDVQMSSNNEGEGEGEVLVQPGPVAVLLRHQAYEVQKSALAVVKIATKVLSVPQSRLINVLPGILPGLIHVAARSKKQETRLRVRVILERLLRKCGRDVLEANFPEDHMKLLAAVRKKFSRDLVKKHAAKDQRKQTANVRNREDQRLAEIDESDDSEDFGVDDSDSDVEREIVDGDDLLLRKKRNRVRVSDGNLHVKEGKDQVMDLLDSKNSQSVLTQGEMKEALELSRLEQKKKRSRDEDIVKYTDDGRPIFVESDDNSGEAEVGSVDAGGDNSDSDDGILVKRKIVGSSRKRQGHESREGGRHNKKMKGSFGEEYRSRRGSGDVKRTGRPDPYAYIPLGGAMLGAKGKSRNDSSLEKLGARRNKMGRGNNFRSGVPGKR